MSTASHNEIKELVGHLDEQLDARKRAEPDFYEWSDGDQLRAVAHSMLDGAHTYLHAMPNVAAMDVSVPRVLLRVAARLDALDEQEEDS